MANIDEKLGQILIRQSLISEQDLTDALKAQMTLKGQGKRVFKLGELLLFQKKISLGQLQGALVQQKRKLEASHEFRSRIKEDIEFRKSFVTKKKGDAKKNPRQSFFSSLFKTKS